MNNMTLLKKLSKILDFQIEYTDDSGKKSKLETKDIPTILNAYGISIKEKENLEKLISELEAKEYRNIIPKVKVIKKSERPIITISIREEEKDNTFNWTVEKENGAVDSGKFIASTLKEIETKNIDENESYIQFEFNIPLNFELGYHTFRINSNSQKHFYMKLIVVPEKCYIPQSVLNNSQIFGPKICLSNTCLQDKNEDSDLKNPKNLIKSVSEYGADIVCIGPINQTFANESGTYNPYIPSDRMFFNTLILNIEDMLKFVEDKELQTKFLSREFQNKTGKSEDVETIDYEEISDLKFKKYKLIYESFRNIHIKNNTEKARMFHSYIKNTNEKLHKLALFSALRESLSTESQKYKNWSEWPKPYQDLTSENIIQFQNTNNELIDFYKFLYWQADVQLREAGQTSYDKKLAVGICTDFSFRVDKNGAETCIYKEYFSNNAVVRIQTDEENENSYCPALIPSKLIESTYSYFVDLIRPNMHYSGALNLVDLEYIIDARWETNIDGSKRIFKVKYPIEDLLGIIALESQRNKCVVVFDSNSLKEKDIKLLNKLGMIEEKDFELEEITNDEKLREYYEYLKINKKIEKPPADKDHFAITKIPNSTYRFQFNKDFGFNDAKEIIPYMKNLGISHIYSSPLLSPRKGSLHGYDIINHNKINQEAGTFEEFESFVDTLHANGMGLIFDVVPNHMGIDNENKWWMDVLENGQSSQYSHYFDIDWNPIKKELKGKVLLPVLGDHYGIVLANGHINFSLDIDAGKLSVNYYEHKFPLNPSSYPTILEHRIDVLKTRLGNNNKDFQEYLSIITVFKNLPKSTATDYEKINERIREKQLAYDRLSLLGSNNYVIKGFIEENLVDFKCSPDNQIAIDRIHNLLEEQVYRLAFWRVSADEINYRRFFDINNLVAVCVEKPDVFSDTLSFTLNLIENKKIDGLRIDHTDGLLEPVKFYKTLQAEISKKINVDFNSNEINLFASDKLPFYIIVEKILAPSEKIPSNWAIHGTVGYDFLNSVNKVFIKSENKKDFTDFYHTFIQRKINFDETVIGCKKFIMNTSLAAELNVLSNHLNQISEMYLFSRDYTLNSLRNALIELVACFPIYRTYISQNEEDVESQSYIKWAIGVSKRRSLTTDRLIFDFIEKILLLKLEEDINSTRYQEILKFTLKFQQYTGPLMAKGFEDTFFYQYNRMVSLNEVGGEPNKFGISIDEFHQQNLNRMEVMPNSLLTTSTHDTKRSEDVRSRINAISEFTQEWQKLVQTWSSINRINKASSEDTVIIDKNDEYLIYQTLIGIYPIEKLNNGVIQRLTDRLESYILKAVKEAKIHTSWININTEYEQALSDFVRKILNYPKDHYFWKSFLPFQNLIADIGYLNSVSQCVLKLTSPGIPDIYQGNEIYKFNLVDPDNRGPVDYKKINDCFRLIQPLIQFDPKSDDYKSFKQVLLPLKSGAIKLFYTTTILNFRNQNSDLFRFGKYIPLKLYGKNTNHFIAFARLFKKQAIIVIVPRLLRNLISNENILQINKEMIEDTLIDLPKEFKNFYWTDICTKKKKKFKEKIYIKDVLDILPVSILYGSRK